MANISHSGLLCVGVFVVVPCIVVYSVFSEIVTAAEGRPDARPTI